MRRGDPDVLLEEDIQREIDTVNEARSDIHAGNLDSFAVNDVMKRRVGSLADYYEVAELLAIAIRVQRACGG